MFKGFIGGVRRAEKHKERAKINVMVAMAIGTLLPTALYWLSRLSKKGLRAGGVLPPLGHVKAPQRGASAAASAGRCEWG